MKAVIMAGGEGSRLRPLTCTIPKPMVRLCGKPIMEYIFDLLIKHSFEEASVTLGYLPHLIEESYKNNGDGLKLNFFREESPLGTAGGVKLAAAHYNEPFAVISGDAMCDYDLSKIVKYHQSIGASATIVTAKVNDPREYGLLDIDAEGRVRGFIEKPAWGQATSDLANTGIYIINPECLSLIPDNQSFDFAKDLFPLMLEKKMPLYCYQATGYWCDIGDITAFMNCQKDILDGKCNCSYDAEQSIVLKDNLPQGDYSIVPPVYIGEQAEIGAGAVIGPYSVVDDGCLIGEGAKLRSSVMFENSYLAPKATMTGAMLCAGASLKKGASMFEGSVAGAGAVISAGASVSPNVLIWPGKKVSENTVVSANIKYGLGSKDLFDDDGIGPDTDVELTPELCARLGAAMGSSKAGKKAGIAFDGNKNAKALSLAMMAGLMATGSHPWNFGECFEAQLSFFTSFCGLGLGIFLYGGRDTAIKVCGEGGLSIPRFLERDIEARLSKGEFNRCGPDNYKDIADMSSIQMIYRQELTKQAPYGLEGLRATVKSSNEKIRQLLRDCLSRLDCADGGGIVLRINKAGTRLSAYSEETNTIPFEKLLAICCLNEFRNGKDIALPFDAPQLLDTLAESCNRKVFRYLSSPADTSDSLARRLAAKQLWVRDGLFLATRILSIMKEREANLADLLAELPNFFITKKTVSLGVPPSRLSEYFGEDCIRGEGVKEGILLKRERGRLLITPSRTGKALKVLAEAQDMETAMELTASVEEAIAGLMKDSGCIDMTRQTE